MRLNHWLGSWANPWARRGRSHVGVSHQHLQSFADQTPFGNTILYNGGDPPDWRLKRRRSTGKKLGNDGRKNQPVASSCQGLRGLILLTASTKWYTYVRNKGRSLNLSPEMPALSPMLFVLMASPKGASQPSAWDVALPPPRPVR